MLLRKICYFYVGTQATFTKEIFYALLRMEILIHLLPSFKCWTSADAATTPRFCYV